VHLRQFDELSRKTIISLHLEIIFPDDNILVELCNMHKSSEPDLLHTNILYEVRYELRITVMQKKWTTMHTVNIIFVNCCSTIVSFLYS